MPPTGTQDHNTGTLPLPWIATTDRVPGGQVNSGSQPEGRGDNLTSASGDDAFAFRNKIEQVRERNLTSASEDNAFGFRNKTE